MFLLTPSSGAPNIIMVEEGSTIPSCFRRPAVWNNPYGIRKLPRSGPGVLLMDRKGALLGSSSPSDVTKGKVESPFAHTTKGLRGLRDQVNMEGYPN